MGEEEEPDDGDGDFVSASFGGAKDDPPVVWSSDDDSSVLEAFDVAKGRNDILEWLEMGREEVRSGGG
jgi:hypothetical protein